MKVLVTGAAGFIGSNIVKGVVNDKKFKLSVCSRQAFDNDRPDVTCYTIDAFNRSTCWDKIVSNQDVVIHTAAITHPRAQNNDNDNLITQVNVEGTVHLATESAKMGVKRFIFISSIGVYGQRSIKSFRPDDPVSPADRYALSKYEAEEALLDISKQTGMEVVIIRPPLVYGPHATGYFASLVQLVQKRLPLPFGLINNKRSFIGVDNLVDFIVRCIDHPNAAGKRLLVSDGVDLSTTEFVKLVSRYATNRSLLIPVPVSVLKLMISVIGKKQLSDKLFGDLQVDSSDTEALLNWKPPFTVDQCMRKCFEQER